MPCDLRLYGFEWWDVCYMALTWAFVGCEEGGSTFSSGGIPHFRKTRQTVRSERNSVA